MHISEIYANGFRCYGPEAPLKLALRRGLNILVGPNDSGKTAVIDAVRFVLWTRGDDFLRLEESDFHVKPDGGRCSEICIRCTFDKLTPDEEARFLEWCDNERGLLRLHVCLRATLRRRPGGGSVVIPQYRSGKNGDGLPLEGDLREYLKATYLKPLRDAERELRPGRRSRLSRILGALPVMVAQADQTAAESELKTLRDTMIQADAEVDSNSAVQHVQGSVNSTYLEELSFADDHLSATLGLGSTGSFDQLLERLELYLNALPGRSERVARGLGYNNILFMAAELLLLQSHPDQVPLLLIEEPEAHLHPQLQTLFMQALELRARDVPNNQSSQCDQQVQVLLSTHSPQLAASAELDAMVMMIGQRAYPLGVGHTKLDEDDYAFLRRFLDATKANLFFARGLLIVEGDAENILLPAIARKIGRPLCRHGISIVKVGHRGLFRYSRILQRADNIAMPIPVALVSDRDIPPDAAKQLVGKRKTESEWSPTHKQKYVGELSKHDGGSVRTFPSQQWTLEFDLARNPNCAALVYQAVRLAKAAGGRPRQEIIQSAGAKVAEWQADSTKSLDDIATHIFTILVRSKVSKVEVAEQLARLVDEMPDDPAALRAKFPAYLVNAIDYVTAAQQSADVEESAGSAKSKAAAE